MFVVGLTGSVGTGKTTVANMLVALGSKILDADKMAHQQLYKGKEGFDKVIKKFGMNILTQGRIDRKKLAEIVFKDKNKLEILEKIIHPAVEYEIQEKLEKWKKTKSIVVLDVPLLFESNLNKKTDLTVVVKTKKEVQVERAMQRLGISRIEVLKRIAAQMPLQQKIRLADIIIDNNGNLKQTQIQVNHLWNNIINRKGR